MKSRIIAAVTAIILIVLHCINVNAGDTLSLSAKSAAMVECNSKELIFEKNSRERLPMASTTKIMTALVVLENLSLEHKFTVSDRAVGVEGTSAYLQKGDSMTVESALYALLLQSANDVAEALAIEVAGSTEAFVSLMNEKAQELSLNDTQFKNPSGLPAEGHYTTACDLAYLASVCLDNEVFFKIVSTKTVTVKISEKDRTFVNHNKLLTLYDGAIGVKTGFTKESGRCLVGAAERNGVKLVTVTLSASNDWNDHKRMLDMGFDAYRSYNLCKKGEFIIELPVAGNNTFVAVTTDESIQAVLPKGKRITVRIEAPSLLFAPINEGETVAYAVFSCDNRVLFRTPLKSLIKVT